MANLNFLNGYKTYLAAAGLLGLSLYQFSIGEIPQGTQTLLSALAAVGLRSAISRPNP